MVPDPSRRAALLDPSRRATLGLAGAALTGGIAGCAALRRRNDPDAGTDSYGILVRNSVDERHDVQVMAKTYDGETVLERATFLESGEVREHDEVLTEDRQYLVRASLPHEHFDGRFASDRVSILVGREDGPTAPNVVVEIYPKRLDGFDGPIHAVRVSV